MRPDLHRRRRDAGLMLVEACEEALGIRGPTALAALTGRSKSWWSKLVSGTAAFPTWEELQGLLPSEMTDTERESLHHGFRRAWLLRYDPELLEWFDSPPARVIFIDVLTLRDTAFSLGYKSGDLGTALRLLKLVERLLVPRGIETLSRPELNILWSSMDQQSVHELDLEHADAAIAAAWRSVEYQRAAGNRLGELLARHTVGQAQQRVGSLSKALKEFEGLRRDFQRLGAESHVIDARRDIGITKLAMRRPEEGAAELLRAYEMPNQSADSQLRTVLWLADASLQQGNGEQARRWLAKLRVIERRHPMEIALPMSLRYIVDRVADLERRAAAPLRPRKR